MCCYFCYYRKSLFLRSKLLLPQNFNLYPASIRTKEGIRWGYINSSGKLVIPIKFAEAFDFEPNGLAIVRENESKLSGLIDKTGNFIVKPIYDFIEYLGEGRFTASVNDEHTVFDYKGKEIFKNSGQVFGFKNGRAAFYSKMPNGTGKYGYIDLQGKVVIPREFETTGMFSNGKAVVKVSDKRYAIIDLNGNILNTFLYEFVGDLQEGLMPFQEKSNSKFGFIDESGKVIIKPQYTLILSGFEEERAVAGIGDIHQSNYGLIDKKGNYIIPPKFDEIRPLGEGRVAVGIHLDISDNPNRPAKYAIADIDGRFLTDFIYYGVDKYKKGLASVFDTKYTYFIYKSGKRVTELPLVEGAGSISILDDIVKADVDDRISYYKKSGELLWSQNTELKLNDIYTIVEKKNKANLYSTAYYPQIKGIENKDVEIKINKKLEKLYKTIKIYILYDNNMEYGVEEKKRAVSRDFEVQFFEKDLLVIKIYGRVSLLYSASVGPILYYSHINLKDGTFYELKGLFKKNVDYIFELNNMMKKSMYFYIPEIHEIKRNPTFYVTKDRLRVYTGKYPTGSPREFQYYDFYFNMIMKIIDTGGGFWNSFR